MLKDALVTHKSFGAGKVTDISDQYITICFEDAIKKFTGKRRQEQPAVYGEMKKHIPCRQGSSVLS